ncbi:kinase-like domain-containing protein [Schizophyllum commune]
MDEYGHVTFLWDDEECEGKLATQPIARGQMKKIYEVCSNGYVAKRFFDVGRGPDMVSIRDNSQYLELDVIRLVYAKFFVKNFYSLCASLNFKDFARVTRFRLAREVIPPNGQPSIASDVSIQQLEKAPSGTHIMWLVEPRRNTQTTRWSGTMAHPRQTSLAGNTVTALAHVAYGLSNKTMVLADLQSTVSGLGDHGQEGVDCFLQEHFCGPVCEQLQVEAWIKDLDDADPQKDDASGEDGGDVSTPAQSLQSVPKAPRSLTPSTTDGEADAESSRNATSSGA